MKQNHNNTGQNNEKLSTNPLFLFIHFLAVKITKAYSKLLKSKKH